uniref:Major facilitator superfamily associated domain-containing protein n=1 Tax=Octactis speculum TaxID=3111310 RepID=A0A7S2DT33_9STRA
MTAPWNRFAPLWLGSRGYSVTSLGAMRGISTLTKVFVQPIWAACGDTYGERATLLVSILFSSFALFLVRYVVLSGDGDGGEEMHAVYAVSLARMFRSSASAVSPVNDALVLAVLNGASAYGGSRMFGSLAWGASSLAAGVLIDWYGFGALFTFIYATSLLYACCLLTIPSMRRHKSPTATASSTMKDGFKLLWSNRSLQAVLAIEFIFSFAMATADVIVPFQFEQQFQTTRATNGIAAMISIVCGIPFFSFFGPISKALTSNRRGSTVTSGVTDFAPILQYSALIGALRFALSSQASTPFMLLATQALHGPTFAINWCASVAAVDGIARGYSDKSGLALDGDMNDSQEVRGTLLSMLTLAYYSLGNGLGGFVMSNLYDNHGPGSCHIASCGIMLLLAYGSTSHFLKRQLMTSPKRFGDYVSSLIVAEQGTQGAV